MPTVSVTSSPTANQPINLPIQAKYIALYSAQGVITLAVSQTGQSYTMNPGDQIELDANTTTKDASSRNQLTHGFQFSSTVASDVVVFQYSSTDKYLPFSRLSTAVATGIYVTPPSPYAPQAVATPGSIAPGSGYTITPALDYQYAILTFDTPVVGATPNVHITVNVYDQTTHVMFGQDGLQKPIYYADGSPVPQNKANGTFTPVFTSGETAVIVIPMMGGEKVDIYNDNSSVGSYSFTGQFTNNWGLASALPLSSNSYLLNAQVFRTSAVVHQMVTKPAGAKGFSLYVSGTVAAANYMQCVLTAVSPYTGLLTTSSITIALNAITNGNASNFVWVDLITGGGYPIQNLGLAGQGGPCPDTLDFAFGDANATSILTDTVTAVIEWIY